MNMEELHYLRRLVMEFGPRAARQAAESYRLGLYLAAHR